MTDVFSKVSQEYDELKSYDTQIPYLSPDDIPIISLKTVENYLMAINTTKAITKDEIPAIIFKEFAQHMSGPATILTN